MAEIQSTVELIPMRRVSVFFDNGTAEIFVLYPEDSYELRGEVHSTGVLLISAEGGRLRETIYLNKVSRVRELSYMAEKPKGYGLPPGSFVSASDLEFK